jgi:hypothetical protein
MVYYSRGTGTVSVIRLAGQLLICIPEVTASGFTAGTLTFLTEDFRGFCGSLQAACRDCSLKLHTVTTVVANN